MRTAVVLAGGLGTRISSVTQGRSPKVLIPVGGRPFLAYKLDELARLGVDRAVLLLGAHADQIVDYVEGHQWSVDVDHRSDGDRLRGTGGAIKHAADVLPDEFWVTYGDTLLAVDLAEVEAWACRHRFRSVMTVLKNDDRWEPSNVSVEADLVVSYRKGDPAGTHDHLDYGYLLLSKAAIVARPEVRFDLAVVVQDLVGRRQLGAFVVSERFHDIGTPEALGETDLWLADGGHRHR